MATDMVNKFRFHGSLETPVPTSNAHHIVHTEL
jgi:hypothetical protein